MAVDGVRLSKGAPQFLGGGAPATAADFNSMMAWANGAVDRIVATIGDLDTITDDQPIYEGKRTAVLNCPGAVFVRLSGAWVMTGVARFTTAAARTSAIAAPVVGMVTSMNGVTQRYDGTAWKNASPAFAPKQVSTNPGTVGTVATSGSFMSFVTIPLSTTLLLPTDVTALVKVTARLEYLFGGAGYSANIAVKGSGATTIIPVEDTPTGPMVTQQATGGYNTFEATFLVTLNAGTTTLELVASPRGSAGTRNVRNLSMILESVIEA